MVRQRSPQACVLLRRCEPFFFRPVSATPFGLMRILWACVVLSVFLMQWPDVTRYYSDQGFVSPELFPWYYRPNFRIGLFFLVGDPQIVFAVYLVFLVSLLCMLAGVFPRLSTIVSVLLLFSFHERNPWVLSGGDTVLRLIGFLLMIAPGGVHALSVQRLLRSRRRKLPPLTMPIWPKRLLLWQLVVLYLMSFWSKLIGTMWLDGTAAGVIFKNPSFVRSPGALMDELTLLSPLLSMGTMFYEGLWGLLLVPQNILNRVPLLRGGGLRWLVVGIGVFFHGVNQVTLFVGPFLGAMIAAYAGILHQGDINALKLFAARTGLFRIAPPSRTRPQSAPKAA